MAATNCVDTFLFGQVCDACDGGAIFKIVSFFLKLISAGVLVLAVVGIIICGVMIISSGSNADRVAKGKKRLIEIIIGIVVYTLMFAIINFIVPGGVVTSTLGTETSSCPEVEPPSGGGKDDDGDDGKDDDGDDGGEDTPSGKYPMAHLDGEKSPGNIKCPRNADYKYMANPRGSKNENFYKDLDDLFQSQANSCPFKEVTYTKTAQDEACAPGGTMHYDADKKWCIVNSKIDLFQYQQYLKDNHISQDGKTCSAADTTCKFGNKGDSNTASYSDYGACYYFSITFASNLNNGEVVSNDAYAAQAGFPNHHAYNGRTRFGNVSVNWNGINGLIRYGDNLSDISIPDGNATPKGPSGGLAQLRQGQAVAYGVHSTRVDSDPSKNCGHYMTAVGFTMDCAGGKSCNANSIVVMNTDGKISTLGNSNYRSGYRRLCSGP